MQQQWSRGGGVVLRRFRLMTILQGLPEHKLVLVTAPGGYGKTTLVRELEAAFPHASFAWLALDPADASLPMFLQLLGRAVARHLPPGAIFPLVPDQALPDSAAVRNLGRLIADELGHHAEDRLVLVLDDLHHVDSAEQVMTFLDALLLYLPDSVHVVIAARLRPHLMLARLQARGEVIQVSAQDLSFTADEVNQFFTERLQLTVPTDLLELLMLQTEGWVVAVQLLSQLLSPLPLTEWKGLLGRSPGGGALFDFLAEEVFEQLTQEIQDFLLGTCILTTLQPLVVERMLGLRGAGALLESLEAHNLLVIPVVDGSGNYRYHPLFQGFLRQRLATRQGEFDLHHLHAMAGKVYESLGNLSEAIEHFLAAGAYQNAAPLMAEQVDTYLKSVRQDVVRGWLLRIPPDLHEGDADILYIRAQLAGWCAQNEVLPLLYQRCLELYEANRDYRGLARCLSWVCNRFWKLRLPYFYEMPVQWAAHEDPQIRIYGRLLQAFGLIARAEWSQALVQLETVLAEIPPATRAYFDCLEILAVLSFWRADSKNALKYGLPHCAGRTAMGDFTWGLYNWMCFLFQADPIGLEMYHRQYMALDIPPVMARMHALVGMLGQTWVHVYHRRWEDAIACFEALSPYFNDNKAGFRALGSEATIAAQLEMANLYNRTGRRAEAKETLQQNLELVRGYPETAAVVFALMADVLREEGDLAGARSYLAKAMAATPPGLQGVPSLSVDVVAAKLAWTEGNKAGARIHLSRAVLVARDRNCAWLMLHKGGADLLPILVDLARTGLPGGHPGQLVFQVLASMGEQTALVLTPFVGHPDPLIRGAAFKLLDYFQRDNSPTLIPTLKSYALGPLRVYRYDQSVETPDWKRNKVKLLWLILLHRRGKPIARDVVADLLWPEAQPVTARNNLRATVHGLKRTLQPDLGAGKDSHYVTGDRETLWLVHLDDMWFDLWEFEDQVARARTALRNGKKEEAAQLFQAACDLCRGAFLPEASFADYFNDLRTRIEQTYILGCLEVARYHMTVRDHRTALEYARRVLALDASIEEAYQVLITGYLSLGEREGAMQAYKTCRKYLRQMLGAEPSTKTRKLLEA